MPPMLQRSASECAIRIETCASEQRLRNARRFHVGPQKVEWWQEDDRLVYAAARCIQRAWCRSALGRRADIYNISEPLLDEVVTRAERYKTGFASLFVYMIATVTFFVIIVLQRNPTSAFAVEKALVEKILSVSLPDDRTLADVSSVEDIHDWQYALVEQTYDSPQPLYPPLGEDVHTCHTCAFLLWNPASEPATGPQFGCGTWQARGQEVPGRCWSRDGMRRTDLNASEASFCSSTCYPTDTTTCAWTDDTVNQNTPFAATGTDCYASFCFGSCVRAGIVPEVPYAADPSISAAERQAALTLMASWGAEAQGTPEEPSEGWTLAVESLSTNTAACQRSAGRFTRRFVQFSAGMPFKLHVHAGEEAGTQPPALITSSSRLFGHLFIVSKRRKKLQTCENELFGHVSASQISRWYGPRCYSELEEATDWRDAGFWKDPLTKKDWVPLSGYFPFVHSTDANGFAISHDMGFFGFGKDLSLCYSNKQRAMGWIDEGTKQVIIKFLTYNGNYGGLYALVEVVFDIELGGYIETSYSVDTFIRKDRYQCAQDYVRLAVEIAFLLFLLDLSHQIVCCQFLLPMIFKGTGAGLRFFLNSENVLDFISIICWWANVGIWITICVDGRSFRPPLDEERSFRWFLLSSCTEVARLQQMQRLANSASIFLSIVKIFVKLQFHERMSIITATITMAAADLVHFMVLYLLVVMAYAFMGFVVFGSRMEEFRQMAGSVVYVLHMSLGGGDLAELEGVNPIIAPLFYWSFVVLVTLLMLNILLAIAVESYDKQKEQTSDDTETLYESILFLQSLSCTCRKKRKLKLDEPMPADGLENELESLEKPGSADISSIVLATKDMVHLREASARLQGIGVRKNSYWYKMTLRRLIERTNVVQTQEEVDMPTEQAAQERIELALCKVLAACGQQQRHASATSTADASRAAASRPPLRALKGCLDDLGLAADGDEAGTPGAAKQGVRQPVRPVALPAAFPGC